MDKCLFVCSIKSGKFDLINWRKGWGGEVKFTHTQQKIFLLFFPLISFKNNVAFFSETEKNRVVSFKLERKQYFIVQGFCKQ